jgi:hypothetical protein
MTHLLAFWLFSSVQRYSAPPLCEGLGVLVLFWGGLVQRINTSLLTARPHQDKLHAIALAARTSEECVASLPHQLLHPPQAEMYQNC